MTLTQKLNRIPPCIARLLAKSATGRLASEDELMRKTGWGLSRLRRVYEATTWEHVTVGEADAFLSACGLKWSSQRRQRWLLQIAYERGGVNAIRNMRHLRFTHGWEASQIERCIRKIEKLFTNESANSNSSR